MEDTPRPWSRVQIAALLAVTAVLAVVVFNWAANATANAVPTQGASPATQQDTLPIQDTQTQPGPPRGGPGGPDDCPERDGRGGPGGVGTSGGSGPEAPQTTAPQPTGELAPEV